MSPIVSCHLYSVVRDVGVLALARVLRRVVGRHRLAPADATAALAPALALVLVRGTGSASLQSLSHALSEDP